VPAYQNVPGGHLPPNWSGIDIGPVYWQNLISSSYALQLDRIYGVEGSEYVGYQPSDIAIGGPEAKPRTQALPVFLGSPSLPSSAVTNLPSVV